MGGMTWLAHLAPPSVVAITAAPFGTPAPPTVDPTAQHLVAVAQSNAVSELTGAGRSTGENAPSQGEPAAMGEADGELVEDVVAVQALVAAATITTDITAPTRERKGVRETAPTGSP